MGQGEQKQSPEPVFSRISHSTRSTGKDNGEQYKNSSIATSQVEFQKIGWQRKYFKNTGVKPSLMWHRYFIILISQHLLAPRDKSENVIILAPQEYHIPVERN